MARRVPKDPTTPVTAPGTPDGFVHQVRRYCLITPLVGGGFDPRKPNEAFPVRGGTVRGHLRFWWRATRGGQFGGDLAQMKAAEAELWGAAATKDRGAGKVEIEVHPAGTPRSKKAYSGRNSRELDEELPAYAAFPLQPDNRGTPSAEVLSDVEFDLHIRYPSEPEDPTRSRFPGNYREEVEAALWAWQTFGGVGGRTRRGFGALELTSIDGREMVVDDVRREVAWGLDTHVVPGPWPEGVAHFATESNSGESVRFSYRIVRLGWKGLIKAYKGFRQKRRPGLGRSYWPEPEAIRRLMGMRLKGNVTRKYRGRVERRFVYHQPLPDSIDKFPRAAFGLPIVFKFKDDKGDFDATKGEGPDPTQTTLQGSSEKKVPDRLASPLLMRPLPYTDKRWSIAIRLRTSGSVVPLAANNLVLKVTARTPQKHKIQNGHEFSVRHRLTESEAKNLPDELQLNDNPDVIQAFLDTL